MRGALWSPRGSRLAPLAPHHEGVGGGAIGPHPEVRWPAWNGNGRPVFPLATVLFHAASVLVLQASGLQTLGLRGFVQYAVPIAMLNAALMPLVYAVIQRGVRVLGGWRQLEL